MSKTQRQLKTAHGIIREVANVRSDWQWKQARLLVTVFDLLVFETLNDIAHRK